VRWLCSRSSSRLNESEGISGSTLGRFRPHARDFIAQWPAIPPNIGPNAIRHLTVDLVGGAVASGHLTRGQVRRARYGRATRNCNGSEVMRTESVMVTITPVASTRRPVSVLSRPATTASPLRRGASGSSIVIVRGLLPRS
jgi:hypothetical protein